MRLIDADTLKEYLSSRDFRNAGHKAIHEAIDLAIDEAPTIEPRDNVAGGQTHENTRSTHACVRKTKELIFLDDAIKTICSSCADDERDEYKKCSLYQKKMCADISALEEIPAMSIAFVCDGRACGGSCEYCYGTTDITHASNFRREGNLFFEKREGNLFFEKREGDNE